MRLEVGRGFLVQPAGQRICDHQFIFIAIVFHD
jgi:hypothetical protein